MMANGPAMRLIGYARVSARQQDADRQEQDLLVAGVRRDDLYVDQGVSGAGSSGQRSTELSRPFRRRTLVVTTLDRLGRFTIDMLGFAAQLRGRGAGLRVLNLGGSDVYTTTP